MYNTQDGSYRPTALLVALEDELPEELLKPFEDRLDVVMYSGVGKINATRATTDLIMQGITHIINYGSAGSPYEYMKGKMFKPSRFVQYDMDVTPLGFKQYQTPLGEDYLQYDEYNMTSQILATSDKFQTNMHTRFQLYDMEAYAIVSTCKYYDSDRRPITSAVYKYVSDSGNPDDWEENNAKGAELFLAELNDII